MQDRIHFTGSIPKALIKRLREYCKKTMVPASRVMERALVEYLDKADKKGVERETETRFVDLLSEIYLADQNGVSAQQWEKLMDRAYAAAKVKKGAV